MEFSSCPQIFPNHYHFRHNSLHKRSATPSPHHHTKLTNDGRVRWAQQQRILSRKKRDFVPFSELKSSSSPADVRLTPPSPLSSSASIDRSDRDLLAPFYPDDKRSRYKQSPYLESYFPLNDVLWPKMWYLVSEFSLTQFWQLFPGRIFSWKRNIEGMSDVSSQG